MIKQIKNKKAQEEIVGFALIIILVAVIFIAILGFSLTHKKTSKAESYEIKNFLEAALEYTVSCTADSEPLRKLIFLCNRKTLCVEGVSSCVLLENTLKELINASWSIGEDSSTRGYKLEIKTLVSGEPILSTIEGNETRKIDGESQEYAEGREKLGVYLSLYRV